MQLHVNIVVVTQNCNGLKKFHYRQVFVIIGIMTQVSFSAGLYKNFCLRQDSVIQVLFSQALHFTQSVQIQFLFILLMSQSSVCIEGHRLTAIFLSHLKKKIWDLLPMEQYADSKIRFCFKKFTGNSYLKTDTK